MKDNKLLELVLKKFRTQAAFAEALGWWPQKASRILNGQQEPTISEIEQMAAALDAAPITLFRFFIH